MLERKQTFEEALNGTAFNTVERQRLAMIQREVFEQLARDALEVLGLVGDDRTVTLGRAVFHAEAVMGS